MTEIKDRILVVDDDIRILRMIRRVLELEGFHVALAGSGDDALRYFDDEIPDLVILDIMMPGMDGYDVCRHIREFSQVPIIFVTARGDDNEVIEGLEYGADDYITKPFSAGELVARVRAVLRRNRVRELPEKPEFRLNDLVIDFISRRVMVAQREIKLTSTEYRLISYLALNAGRIVTPDQILEQVWGREYMGTPHLLQVNIARLRKKIGDSAHAPAYISTRPGIGYILAKQS